MDITDAHIGSSGTTDDRQLGGLAGIKKLIRGAVTRAHVGSNRKGAVIIETDAGTGPGSLPVDDGPAAFPLELAANGPSAEPGDLEVLGIVSTGAHIACLHGSDHP